MFPQPGTYVGVPNGTYHGSEGVSSSTLKSMLRSAADYREKYVNKSEQKNSEALLKGSVVHKLVLEPDDFANEFIIQPEMPGRNTKAGKEAHAEFQKEVEASGKTPVPIALYEKMKECADTLISDPAVASLLSNGVAEMSVCWRDPATGLLCKCRPDYWVQEEQIILDLKTTRDGRPDKFLWSAVDYFYHLQAAWYLRGMKEVGFESPRFIFLAVETESPFNWGLYEIEPEELDTSYRAADALLMRIWTANTLGAYPNSYTGGKIQRIKLPKRAKQYGGLV